jgi:anthranilate phosphoribosyltransferase
VLAAALSLYHVGRYGSLQEAAGAVRATLDNRSALRHLRGS